jgi:sugar phosphate isomerase/epimerase
MHLSIFSSVITGANQAEVARKTRAFGLRSVQLVPDEVNVGWGFDGTGASGSFESWAEAYGREGIEICAIAGYLNLLHHDETRRRQNIDIFKSFLHDMNTIGCRYISTETGSFAPTGDWDFDPKNRTQQAWDELRRVTADLVETAARENAVILYEPYIVNVCYSPELGAKFVREVNSPHLALLLDPTNWFETEMAHPDKVREVIDRGFAAERGLFRLAHAKDVTPAAPDADKPGLPGPGKGIIDYGYYAQKLREHNYNGPLIMEHLTEADIPEAMRYVQGFIDQYAQRSEPDLAGQRSAR